MEAEEHAGADRLIRARPGQVNFDSDMCTVPRLTLDGEQRDVSGSYRQVEKNRKLVFTWAWISPPEEKLKDFLRLKPFLHNTH